MNIQEKEILRLLNTKTYTNQREISKDSHYSLGLVNSILKNLRYSNYIDENMKPTDNAKKEFKNNFPKNAVILAAGYGMRMVPINLEIPKGLLKIRNECLIERTIKQLNEAGISEIYIVVGFMKESYEYLIDKYNVKLIYNPDYPSKNNLYSVYKALEYLSNTYIIPCDIWCRENPFSKDELFSWYMLSSKIDENGLVKVNKKLEIVSSSSSTDCNKMIGISYLTKDDSEKLKTNIKKMVQDRKYNNSFWEDALFEHGKMFISANIDRNENAYEINTYEELRDLDSNSRSLDYEAIKVISKSLNCQKEEIVDISVLKKGMTNRSFMFSCKSKKYIMRIPGEGTDKLINRKEEAEVYKTITNKEICDDIIYINPQNGYKITKYLTGARVCDPLNRDDLHKCMEKLKQFHKMKLTVGHEFNIWKKIDFYENLWDGKESIYEDYKETKENVFSLKSYVDKNVAEKVLTHIDAVPDNFLFVGNNEIRLIDWEYAGLQDPHVDIAMFSIYSMYDRENIDKLIDIYFENNCDIKTRIKIYCYIAMCGLLWSNWCEYKRNLGVEFGEYSLAQYRYAKDYYNIVKEELNKMNIYAS